MSMLKRIALSLIIIGAINWGLIGLFQFDLVAAVFGGQSAILSRIVYTLVGVSGLYSILLLFSPLMDGEGMPDPLSEVNYGTEFGDEINFKNDENE